MSRILIIDDDVASCRTLQLHFQSQGHTVDLAHNLDDGIDKAKTTQPEMAAFTIQFLASAWTRGLSVCPAPRRMMTASTTHTSEANIP